MIHLAQSGDGRLILASSDAFPADIERVEYYRDLRLFMLVYEGAAEKSDLMPCEISEDVAKIVKTSPDIIVIVRETPKAEPYGYIAPLVQVGL